MAPTLSVRRSAPRALVAGLALALLVATAPSSHWSGGSPSTVPVAHKATSYTPRTGATFNRPVGLKPAQRRILLHVNRTVDAVPRGGTIRIAVFSFSEKATADALLRARARGVRVQMIISSHKIYSQESRLRRALGTNRNARSFMLYCPHSCRGTSGDMHVKIFMFSRAGRARYVTMVGSNNMTSYNAERQWSDVYTVANDRAMYLTYSGLFNRLRLARSDASPFYQRNVTGHLSQFYPARGVRQSNDPMMKTLSHIGCRGAARGSGYRGRTLVRVSQHAWFDQRGVYLAKRVAALRGRGCVVQVIPGITMGVNVRRILKDARVRLATVRRPRARTHQKVLTVSGVYHGNRGAHVVFAGSQNWSDRGFTNDDVVLRIRSARAYRQYAANFVDIWRHG